MVTSGGHVLDVADPVVVREWLEMVASWQGLKNQEEVLDGKYGQL